MKIWNFDAHALRGTSFFKGILDYRKEIWPSHKHQILKPKDFRCVLCGGRKGKSFLSWKGGYELFSCPKCGAVSANIAAEVTHFDDTYNNDVYYRKFKREILKHYDYRKKTQGQERFNYVVKRLKFNSKKIKVLDVGCGAGYFLSVLKEQGVWARGLEVNPAQVRYGRGRGLNVSVNDLADEPDNYYDVITMFDVLEHLFDPLPTIKKVSRKLKPGGYFVAYTPNIHSLGFDLMGSKQNNLLPFEHFVFFNKPSFGYLSKNAGLKITSLEIFGFDVMDYLLMKEYEDGIYYTEKLKDFMNLSQALVDKLELGNHFRLTLKKPKGEN